MCYFITAEVSGYKVHAWVVGIAGLILIVYSYFCLLSFANQRDEDYDIDIV